MSLSRAQLKKVKESLGGKSFKSNKSKIKKAIKRETKPKVTVTKWNLKTNDLVSISYYNEAIGLIVSDYVYMSNVAEKNNFFVLFENRVVQLEGKYLRKI